MGLSTRCAGLCHDHMTSKGSCVEYPQMASANRTKREEQEVGMRSGKGKHRCVCVQTLFPEASVTIPSFLGHLMTVRNQQHLSVNDLCVYIFLKM